MISVELKTGFDHDQYNKRKNLWKMGEHFFTKFTTGYEDILTVTEPIITCQIIIFIKGFLCFIHNGSVVNFQFNKSRYENFYSYARMH